MYFFLSLLNSNIQIYNFLKQNTLHICVAV